MKKGLLITLGVIVVVLFIIGGSVIGTYNGLVTERQNVKTKLSDIDIQLQRRADLIPNLVSSVKGYTQQERDIINSITDARKTIASNASTAEKNAASNQISDTVRNFNINVENYPNLKSDVNFRQLMDDISGTENRISVSRKDYNTAVQTYNTKIATFPTNILAGIFGFKESDLFVAPESAKENQKVDFSSK